MNLEKTEFNESAQKIIEITEKILKEDPNFEKLSDDAKSLALVMGSCLVFNKLFDLFSKGVKEIYDRHN